MMLRLKKHKKSDAIVGDHINSSLPVIGYILQSSESILLTLPISQSQVFIFYEKSQCEEALVCFLTLLAV